MHGHRFAPHPFQGSLNFCFTCLGFRFLKIEEAPVGLAEHAGETL